MGWTGLGTAHSHWAVGWVLPTPRLQAEMWGGQGGEEVNHCWTFPPVPALCGFVARLWTFPATARFLGIFPRHSAQSMPREAASTKDTGLQADSPGSAPFSITYQSC